MGRPDFILRNRPPTNFSKRDQSQNRTSLETENFSNFFKAIASFLKFHIFFDVSHITYLQIKSLSFFLYFSQISAPTFQIYVLTNFFVVWFWFLKEAQHIVSYQSETFKSCRFSQFLPLNGMFCESLCRDDKLLCVSSWTESTYFRSGVSGDSSILWKRRHVFWDQQILNVKPNVISRFEYF